MEAGEGGEESGGAVEDWEGAEEEGEEAADKEVVVGGRVGEGGGAI